MNLVFILIGIGMVLFFFQIVFFVMCLRWLASGKHKRDKEFAIIDSERSKLFELQSLLKQDMECAHKLSKETLNKLKIIGTEAHAEWEDMTKKVNEVLIEVDKNSQKMMETNIEKINKQHLKIEKTLNNAFHIEAALILKIKEASKIIKLFDTGLPTEEVIKEIQMAKYTDAKKMLCEGIDASVVAKTLGMSVGEVVFLSSMA